MDDKENPLASIASAMVMSPQDWSAHHRDAWVYGIACGWDDEALAEVARRHRWTPEAVERLKRLRRRYLELAAASE